MITDIGTPFKGLSPKPHAYALQAGGCHRNSQRRLRRFCLLLQTTAWIGGATLFFHTIELIKANGMIPLGVGENLEEARKPVIIDLDGTKIGLFRILLRFAAGLLGIKRPPGLCPTARNQRRAVPNEHDQPGTPVTVYTWPHPEDLENMLEDIRMLRPKVDILMVSMHWAFISSRLFWHITKSMRRILLLTREPI